MTSLFLFLAPEDETLDCSSTIGRISATSERISDHIQVPAITHEMNHFNVFSAGESDCEALHYHPLGDVTSTMAKILRRKSSLRDGNPLLCLFSRSHSLSLDPFAGRGNVELESIFRCRMNVSI
jgi:hypothetical protein